AIRWAVLPIVAAGLDYLENLFAWLALAAYPGSAITDPLLGLATAAKATVSWASGVLLIVGLVVLAARRAHHRPRIHSRSRGAAVRS
ncbi:MAG: hypothetical protein AAGK32_05490, partial [Actinomycetota bacterium]